MRTNLIVVKSKDDTYYINPQQVVAIEIDPESSAGIVHMSGRSVTCTMVEAKAAIQIMERAAHHSLMQRLFG